MNRVLGALIIAGAVISGIGCASPIVYLNRDVKTVVAMVPLEMEAQDAGCGVKLLPYIETQLNDRGYTVVTRETLLAWYASKHYSLGDEAKDWSTADLCKEFNVDGVVWTNISKWGKIMLGIHNEIGVKFHAELQGRDGVKMWEGDGEADGSNTSIGRGSLFSLVVNTIATAVADPEKYAPEAAGKCFGSLGHAGWDPAVLKKREEDAKKANPAPPPDAPR